MKAPHPELAKEQATKSARSLVVSMWNKVEFHETQDGGWTVAGSHKQVHIKIRIAPNAEITSVHIGTRSMVVSLSPEERKSLFREGPSPDRVKSALGLDN